MRLFSLMLYVIVSFCCGQTSHAMSPGEIGVVATRSTIRMKSGRHSEVEPGTVVFILDAVEGKYLVVTQAAELLPKSDDEVHSGWIPEASVESTQDSLRRWTVELSEEATRISAFFNRGKVHSVLRHPDDAISDFGRVIELNPNCVGAFLCRAEVYRRTGRCAEAIADTSSVLRSSPTLISARLMQAKLLADDNRIEEAVEECDRALRSDPASHNAMLFRGYLHVLNGRFKEAQADAEASKEAALFLRWIPPKATEYQIQLPNAPKDREPGQTVPWSDFKFWTNLSYVVPSSASQLILFGALAEKAGKSTDSLRLLGAALQLRLSPRAELIALQFSASANMARSEDAEALRKFSNAIQLANSHPQSIPLIASKSSLESGEACCRAGIHRDSENFAKAVTEYDEAIRLNAKNYWAYLGRGVTHGLMNELDSAMKDFDTVVESTESSAKCQALAFAGRAGIHLFRGDSDGALSELDRGIEIKQDLVDLWDYRALTWARRGEFQKALSDSNEALRQQPNYPQCYRARALIAYLMGDLPKCLATYQRAVQLNLSEQELDSALALSQRGLIRFQFGQFAESLSDFESAIKRNPKCTLAHAGLATLRSTCSDPTYRDGPSAVGYARTACELSHWRRGRHIMALAAALAESGEFEMAIEELKKAADVDPTAGANQREMMLKAFSDRKPYRADIFPNASPPVSWESIPFAAP